MWNPLSEFWGMDSIVMTVTVDSNFRGASKCFLNLAWMDCL